MGFLVNVEGFFESECVQNTYYTSSFLNSYWVKLFPSVLECGQPFKTGCFYEKGSKIPANSAFNALKIIFLESNRIF